MWLDTAEVSAYVWVEVSEQDYLGMDNEKPLRLARAVNLVLGLWSSLQGTFASLKLVRTEQKLHFKENLCYG